MRPPIWTLLALLLVGCEGLNHAPRLSPIDEEPVFFVGSRHEIELRAHDPDGDELMFTFYCATIPDLRRSNRAKIVTFSDRAIFSWEPIGSDVWPPEKEGGPLHQLDFTVSDSIDFDIETVMVEVKPTGDEEPRFLEPANSGDVLDLNDEDTFFMEIEVEDLDSREVEIYQDEPLEYSRLEQTGDFTAKFWWTPRDWQVEESTEWLTTLVADDGEHRTKKAFTISIIPKD